MSFIFGMLALFNWFHTSTYQDLSDEIIVEHRNAVLKPRQLPIYAIGGGNDGDIRTINLGVLVKKPLTIEEGRRLVVSLGEDLIKRYNSSQKIRPLLKNYPYTPNNLTYTISCMKNGDICVLQDPQHPENEISHISMFRGKKIYYSVNLSNACTPLKRIHEETYEEAKKILAEENNKSG